VAAKQFFLLALTVGLLIAPYWYVPAASAPGETSARIEPVDQPRCVSEDPQDHKREANITATVEQAPGERAVTITYDLSKAGADTIQLEFLGAGIQVLNTSGFTNEFANRYESDGRTRPSLTYSYPNTEQGYNMTGRQYAAGDEWANAPHPDTVLYKVNYTVLPSGVVDYNPLAKHTVYIGNLTQTTTELGCQTIALYTSPGLGVNSERVLTSLQKSVKRFAPGKRYQTVRVVISPWNMKGKYGFARGNYAVVSAMAREKGLLTTAVVHEYIHTRQTNNYADEMNWMVEAVATYYGQRLQYEAGVISTVRYSQLLTERASGAEWGGPFSAVSNENHYERGAATLSALDASVRNATGGKKNLQDVLLRLEEQPRPILTQRDLEASIATVTNGSLSGWVDRHVSNGTPVETATPGERDLTSTQWSAFYAYHDFLSGGILHQLLAFMWVYLVLAMIPGAVTNISQKLLGLLK
jgi:hypothetical protein